MKNITMSYYYTERYRRLQCGKIDTIKTEEDSNAEIVRKINACLLEA